MLTTLPTMEAVRLSDEADGLIFSLCPQAPPATLLAVGGYGRRELCPRSDLDLLILIPRRSAPVEPFLQEAVYPLWDAGYTVSYSVRTPRQALADSRDDLTLLTSLLDARTLCGDPALLERLLARLRRRTGSRRFFQDLAAADHQRHRTAPPCTGAREPHLKDGRGGLRDLQRLNWALTLTNTDPADLLTGEDRHVLDETRNLLLALRHALHQASPVPEERLLSELLPAVCAAATPHLTPEQLLTTLHRTCRRTAIITEDAVKILMKDRGGKPFFQKKGFPPHPLSKKAISFCSCPQLVLGECGLPSVLMADGVGKCQTNVCFSKSSPSKKFNEAQPSLLTVLRGEDSETVLLDLLERGELERMLPEFAHLVGRPQMDPWHELPVDEHLVRTVGEMAALLPMDFEGDRDVLLVAALLHDMGKGLGRPHAEAGAEPARALARRLGLDAQQAGEVAFLVRHHLLLPDTATRRDLDEEATIETCVRTVGSEKRLEYLALLAEADALATGPPARSPWRMSLVRELTDRCARAFTRGIFRDPDAARRLDERWRTLQEQTPSGTRGRLWMLPQAYVLATGADDILRHLELSTGVSEEHHLVCDPVPFEGHTRVTLLARDAPGLAATLAGILAVLGMDIRAARLFTWQGDLAVDVFDVVTPWEGYDRWERVPELFKRVRAGEVDLAHELGPPSPGDGLRIRVDNEASDFFTLVEVRAPDSPGLFSRLAAGIDRLDLTIHRAYAGGTGLLVTDVFYLLDKAGAKISDHEHPLHHMLARQIFP